MLMLSLNLSHCLLVGGEQQLTCFIYTTITILHLIISSRFLLAFPISGNRTLSFLNISASPYFGLGFK